MEQLLQYSIPARLKKEAFFLCNQKWIKFIKGAVTLPSPPNLKWHLPVIYHYKKLFEDVASSCFSPPPPASKTDSKVLHNEWDTIIWLAKIRDGERHRAASNGEINSNDKQEEVKVGT